MSTHSDKVREQERRVVEAAMGMTVAPHDPRKTPFLELSGACHLLRELRAATCPTCHGAGGEWFDEFSGDSVTHHCNECPDCKGTGRKA